MKRIFFFIIFYSTIIFMYGQSERNSKIIDSIKINVLNQKNLDSLKFANAHYTIGELYRYSLDGDSAYYHYNIAEKYFRSLNDRFKRAITLYGIAVIQKNEKDLTGSELTSIEALGLLESIPESDEVLEYKSYLCNNLGQVFGFLKQYEESVFYHKKALQLKERREGDNFITINITKNNLAFVYKESGQYALAKKYYEEILASEQLKRKRPDIYALVLDNHAHTLDLMGQREELPELYLDALKFADSLQTRSYNSIIIHQHLAEYYHRKNMKDSALYYAYKAKDISEDYFNDDLLKSLKILSEIETGEKSAQFLKEYIKLSDSLQQSERAIRNKFARIRFETDQIEKENIEIAKQRKWLFGIALGILVFSIFVYIIITQRNKNRELKFIQEQQEANEEIYNLMLSQNENIEEARAMEKKRISEELHDGVLGRLFGTRLSLDSLNFNNTPEAVKTRAQYISELKTIEEDIRKVSHELNTDFVSGSGFIDIIKTLVETQCLAYNLDYRLDYDETINWDEVSNKKKIHIYRIVQESLHNTYKHANASTVKIRFKMKKNVICLTIIDDGTGFDINKAKTGIGLKNMNSRLEEIDGSINISSERDKGTKVKIKIPVA